MRPRLTPVFSLFCALALACSGPADPDAGSPDAGVVDPGPPRAVFELPREGADHAFFDLPFPSDLRLTAEGTVDVSSFPNPRGNAFVQEYLDAFRERQRGFGTNGAIYFRFSRSVDVATLPVSFEDDPGASVLLIDVDPESPTFGRRHPIVVHYQDAATRFWAAHTVALRPVYGIPLASARRYAAVITTAVQQQGGGAFERDADFEAILGDGGDAAVQEARALYAEPLAAIEDAGVTRSDILAMTVFTTQDAIGELLAIRDWMVSEYPPPDLVEGSLEIERDGATLQEVTGRYGPSPIFQEGTVPYQNEGGAIELDASGAPTVHGTFEARFSIGIPKTPMPENGYPIVLYAHGTTGNYRSFVSDEGSWLAPLGFAMMGVDQIHHGARNPLPGVDPSVLFFNFTNPDAGRDNNRQSALDVVQQARVVGRLQIEGLPGRTEAVRFDPTRIYFMGHSQGGLNGPIYLAIDDTAHAGVLSAASGVITPSLIEKTQPEPGIPFLVSTLLGLPGSDWMEAFEMEGFTVEHPIATLVQTWIEVADGVNYAHLIFAAPREGFAPKSILMTEGLMDAYSPPASIEALAGAMFVPQVEPVHAEIAALSLRGIEALSPPVTMNVAGGAATAGILQFPNDGHFAIYQNETARLSVLRFFESLAAGGPGTIAAP